MLQFADKVPVKLARACQTVCLCCPTLWLEYCVTPLTVSGNLRSQIETFSTDPDLRLLNSLVGTLLCRQCVNRQQREVTVSMSHVTAYAVRV